MEQIYEDVKTQRQLPECWIIKRDYIIRHTVKDGGLPYVSSIWKKLLNFMGIPYRDSQFLGPGWIEFWNPDIYEEENLTLPKYEKKEDGYRYIGLHTEKIPTRETVEAANQIKIKLENAIADYCKKEKERKDEEEKKNIFLWSKEVLKQEACIGTTNFWIQNEKDLEYGDEHIIIIPIDNKSLYKGYNMVVNMNNIEPNSEITMKVPKGEEGIFVGREGEKVKELSKKIGVKKIHVISF